MKAVTRVKYGPPDVLRYKELQKPTPADSQVLVRVHAASINKADLYSLNPPLPMRLILGTDARKPARETIGSDLSGVVETVGKNVTRFKPGDEVFGCGRGSFAEYAVASEDYLTSKPKSLSFEESAALPVAGLTALQGLRKGRAREGQRVLICGASGGVGTFAVQIAKAFGTEVTAVCSPGNVENARRLGADHVIDYSTEDFTRSGKKYDLVLGVHGYHSVLSYRRILDSEGIYLMVGSSRPLRALVETILVGRLASSYGNMKMGFMGVAKVIPEDLAALGELSLNGKVQPFIDRLYPLARAPDAFRYFAEGHARGKVVVTVESNSEGSQGSPPGPSIKVPDLK